ncbi:MAG: hypothetical protein ACLPY1_15510 [Terracidiphilus sp.]
MMTDAEKLADYDRLVKLLEDRIKLEKYYREHEASFQTINDVRAHAYLEVVKLIIGVAVLP